MIKIINNQEKNSLNQLLAVLNWGKNYAVEFDEEIITFHNFTVEKVINYIKNIDYTKRVLPTLTDRKNDKADCISLDEYKEIMETILFELEEKRKIDLDDILEFYNVDKYNPYIINKLRIWS